MIKLFGIKFFCKGLCVIMWSQQEKYPRGQRALQGKIKLKISAKKLQRSV